MTDALMDRIKAHRSAPDVYDPPTFDQMADRIEQTEAKLAKAVEALRDATQMLSQCTFTTIRIKGQYLDRHEVIDEARTVLARLEGIE